MATTTDMFLNQASTIVTNSSERVSHGATKCMPTIAGSKDNTLIMEVDTLRLITEGTNPASE